MPKRTYESQLPKGIPNIPMPKCKPPREEEQPTIQFRKDMLAAFRHGIEFEYRTSHGKDVNPETLEDKNLPFAEWFNKYYQG